MGDIFRYPNPALPVPFKYREDDKFILKFKLGDEYIESLVDSGCTVTCISASTLDEIGLYVEDHYLDKHGKYNGNPIYGRYRGLIVCSHYNGVMANNTLHPTLGLLVENISIGGVKIGTVEIGTDTSGQLHDLLGTNIINKFKVDLDYPNKRISFYEPDKDYGLSPEIIAGISKLDLFGK